MDDEALSARRWFHAIDFGDGVTTPGRFARDVPPNYTLFGFFDLVRHVDLSEARCVDVGAMDGLAAFVLKALGARDVMAVDMSRRKTFELARDRLGLDVGYRTPVSAEELPALLGDDRADLIVLAGVLYHVLDPMTVLMACRDALKRGGLLFVETSFLFDEGRPNMEFNLSPLAKRRLEQVHTYWRPSKSALHGMLRLASFDVVATRVVHGRVTVLAQARRPSELDERDPLTEREQASRDRHYRKAADFAELERDEGPAARVRYDGPRDDRVIHRALFEPEVPLQPRWRPSSELARARDLATSARMHAALRAAEARAALGAQARAFTRRLRGRPGAHAD